MALTYAKAFFDLQLEFAQTVAARSGVPYARAVLEYTNLYVRFGLGRDFDPAHPTWQAYVDGLSRAEDPGDWTARLYATRPQAIAPPALVATFGCFSYGRLRGQFVDRRGALRENAARELLALEAPAEEFSAFYGM